MPEAEQGMNVARAAAIRAGLPVGTSAMTINRFCSSGLQSIAIAADRIRTGSAEVAVAGGLETMSMIPMGGHTIRPNPYLVEQPRLYLKHGTGDGKRRPQYESLARSMISCFAFTPARAAALDAESSRRTCVMCVGRLAEGARGRREFYLPGLGVRRIHDRRPRQA